MADFTEVNRQYFDKLAKSYKDDFAQAVRLLSSQVYERRLWISDKWTDIDAGKGQDIKMLEYACGPGAVSITLAPFLTKVVGLDLSDNMVDEFNKNSREAGLADKMVAYKGDLLADPIPAELTGPEFSDFDIVVVSMAFHHLEDPALAMKRLGDRLKKGGVCLIIDFLPHGHHHHHHHHDGVDEFKDKLSEASSTIKTHGFSMEDMKKLYLDAGLSANFDFKVVDEPIQFTKGETTIKKTIFVARAQRV